MISIQQQSYYHYWNFHLFLALRLYINIVIRMHSQNNEDDSINFSIIGKDEQKVQNIDFSIGQLLDGSQELKENRQEKKQDKKTKDYVFNKMKNIQQNSMNKSNIRSLVPCYSSQQNQFLKDLQKMEKELSFQTQQYNIYEDNPNISTEIVSNNKSKTLSALKITKESNKSINKSNQINFNEYFGELILDFNKTQSEQKLITQSKNSSSNFSHENVLLSTQIIPKKSKNKHFQTFFRSKQKEVIIKSHKFTSPQQIIKRSKSKTMNDRLKPNFKSPKNLKVNTEAEELSSKVISEYYGSETNFNKPFDKQNKTKKKSSMVSESMKSKEKTMIKSKSKSKSKLKFHVLSPRAKPSITTVYTKK